MWSCHSLKSPDRNPKCSCSPGRHRDICIRLGNESVGCRVQVSSLTGSCPYLVWVAPSDRLKVSAHLIYIDDNCLFYFIFFPVCTIASDKKVCLRTIENQKKLCFLVFISLLKQLVHQHKTNRSFVLLINLASHLSSKNKHLLFSVLRVFPVIDIMSLMLCLMGFGLLCWLWEHVLSHSFKQFIY